MADEKKYSPKEAAVAVLKKFIELSTKAEAPLRKDEAPMEGGADASSMAESEKPAEAAVEKPVKGHVKLAHFMGHVKGKHSAQGGAGIQQNSGNNTPAQPIGGNPKELDKSQTGHEKGIHMPNKPVAGAMAPGESAAGRNVALGGSGNKAAAIDQNKQVLGEMKQMPKPKLPG